MYAVTIRFIIPLYFLSLVACSSDEGPETIELESLLPQSKYQPKETEASEEELTYSPILRSFEKYFPKWDVIDTNTEASLFPDRFSYEQRSHHVLSMKDKKIELFHWTFKDSVTTLSTFFNWLDCLGEDCMSLRTFDDTLIQEYSLFSIWVGEQQLIHMKGTAVISTRSWSEIMDSTFTNEKWLYRMHQYSRKRIEWLPKKSEISDSLSSLPIKSK